MEKTFHLTVGYIIDKRIESEAEVTQYLENIQTYISHVDAMYIYNTTGQNLDFFYQRLNSYTQIEYTDAVGYSEVELYNIVMEKGIQNKSKYAMVIKPGYYFEDGHFSSLIKYLIISDAEQIAVLTPMPLYSCEIHERKAEEYRPCKGCKLVGTFVNIAIFEQEGRFKEEYYQTTFDYDYCLKVRSHGYVVMLAQNEVLRNQNYKVISKKALPFVTLSTYERDLNELYYETRGRYYLWDEYKTIDPAYVKLDKKLFALEKRELRFRDKNNRDKFEMIHKGYEHYKKGIKGKYQEF